ncbi:XRE family transcriptional regulator [Burkholderia cepacia]|uniref:helix-turn-helix domain-containing protein n=1 Tax=Burkholderia cepacia TaxID=292 RepID=UPI000F5E9AB1|nr:helix-turn-helix transcriptional regulator [Burkholderia cepacia]RQZ58130.1 XRE family transcriptional regulator [Burkholderia cepacia]
MTIHQRIKERREALGLSMEALGERVGVVWQTVQQWERENGGTAPKRERLQKVADALETTPEYLSFGEKGGVTAGTVQIPALSEPARVLVDLVCAADAKGLPSYQFASIAAALRILVNQLDHETLAAGD